MITFKPSRRWLVSTATVAAIAPAVPAAAGALPAVQDDTELLRLGVQLLRVHRALDALEANGNATDEDWRSHLDEQAALVPQILRLTATTREGAAVQAAAAIRACRELWEDHTADEQGALQAERPFLEAMARYCDVPVPTKVPYRGPDFSAEPRSIEPSLVDPIFAAIEAHQRAWIENEQQGSQLDAAMEAGDAEAERKLRQLTDAVYATQNALIHIKPTTLKGIAALLEYAVDHVIDRGDRWPDAYVIEDASGQEHNVYWEDVLHVSLVEALKKIAA
jgi:hypothetical protein